MTTFKKQASNIGAVWQHWEGDSPSLTQYEGETPFGYSTSSTGKYST
jgi:hypothetical protein